MVGGGAAGSAEPRPKQEEGSPRRSSPKAAGSGLLPQPPPWRSGGGGSCYGGGSAWPRLLKAKRHHLPAFPSLPRQELPPRPLASPGETRKIQRSSGGGGTQRNFTRRD
ncbi:UNVERIFIED_CONTAM: hypothetical protein K2H54_035631 [Gekko kuhli]